jgi:hypothetical protein
VLVTSQEIVRKAFGRRICNGSQAAWVTSFATTVVSRFQMAKGRNSFRRWCRSTLGHRNRTSDGCAAKAPCTSQLWWVTPDG